MARGPTPKCHFLPGLPSWSPEIPKIKTPTNLEAHNFFLDLRSKWSLKQSCSPRQELSNKMWHATCTQGNQGNSRLLMVGSQIGNWTLGLSFGHNSCLKNLNGSCEPISDIYIPRTFQWYMELLNPMSFDTNGSSLKFQLPKWGLIWECGGSSFTLSYTPGNMKCDFWAHFWWNNLQ